MGDKDNKSLAMITAIVSEEVSQHIFPATYFFQALKRMKDMFGSHTKMEVIQMMLKLFNLEVKDNHPMIGASDTR